MDKLFKARNQERQLHRTWRKNDCPSPSPLRQQVNLINQPLIKRLFLQYHLTQLFETKKSNTNNRGHLIFGVDGLQLLHIFHKGQTMTLKTIGTLIWRRNSTKPVKILIKNLINQEIVPRSLLLHHLLLQIRTLTYQEVNGKEDFKLIFTWPRRPSPRLCRLP